MSRDNIMQQLSFINHNAIRVTGRNRSGPTKLYTLFRTDDPELFRRQGAKHAHKLYAIWGDFLVCLCKPKHMKKDRLQARYVLGNCKVEPVTMV